MMVRLDVMALLLSTLTLILFVQLEASQFVDYRLVPRLNSTTTFADNDCVKQGVMCKNCHEVVFCENFGGQWVQKPMHQCPMGQICSDKAGTCIPDTNAECPILEGIPFPCSTPGIFPDPEICTGYHMCSPDRPNGVVYNTVYMDCENGDGYLYGYSYNPRTYFCDKKLPSTKKCSGYPIPHCKKEFESAPLRDNPSLYYTCLPVSSTVLYPFQKACDNGKRYSSTYGCQ